MDEDLFDVKGLPVLVTGGSSGLGLQSVWLFASRGARVCSVATVHDAKVTEALVALNPDYPVAFISADLRKPEGVTHALDAAQAAHGTPRVIVNNAGISSRQRFLEVGRSDWEALTDINVKAMFFVAQEAARRMIADDVSGSIINMTSILAKKTMTGTALYSSAKA
ncbi:MAG: SDR family NAD(P)-dependent oxidoreductase, partial [Rhizobiaceae bacterium]